MKKTTLFSLLLMCLSLAISSCNKDDDSSSSDSDGFLTCKIDGSDYEAEVGISASLASGVFAVQGGTNAGETIRLTIGNGYSGAGTYQLGGSTINLTQSGTYIQSPTDPVNTTWLTVGAADNSGDVVVTLDDGEWVEGTFSFSAFNGMDGSTKSITNGAFKAKVN